MLFVDTTFFARSPPFSETKPYAALSKIQISLTQEQHRSLLEVAAKEHKDIEVIVREALERTCLARHQTETVRHAATALLTLASQADTPPPEDYQAWEEEYGRVKWAGHGG